MSHALSDPAESEASVQGRPSAIVAVLAFAGIVTALMQTLIVPLVPDLPRLLNTSSANAAWAVTATLLAASVATPVAGRLGDMYGKRRVLLISLGLLVVGSAVAAVASSLAPMVAGRLLQGLAGGVIPLGISVMRDVLPAERLGVGTATMSSSLGVGGALGLPLAALLADVTSWHALFWISAALGAAAAALVLAVVPESRLRTGGRFDFAGAVGLSVALVCLLLAISKGGDWGWTSGLTLGLFAAAAAAAAMWAWWELRTRQPLLDLRTTTLRAVLLTNLASVAIGFAMFAIRLVFPQVLQVPTETGYGLAQPMVVVGLVMAPQGLVMMAMAPLAARLTAHKGPNITLLAGAAAVGASYAIGIPMMTEIWQLILVSCINGVGIGLAYGAMPALIMASVSKSETASANSVNALMRSIGNSVSSAVAGVIVAHMAVNVGGASFASLDGLRTVMAVGCAASILAAAITAFIPRPSRT